jgi:hypothetical protein
MVQARREAPSCNPTDGKWPASVHRCDRLAVWKANPASVAVTVHDETSRRRVVAWKRTWRTPTA